jgi:uncharacterized protein YbaR (Trm112 family)
VSISADLLSILACPSADHAPLRLETTGDGLEQLVCTACLSRFPVSDGIAVLLADEAVPGPRGLGVPVTDQAAGTAADSAAPGEQPGTTG